MFCSVYVHACIRIADLPIAQVIYMFTTVDYGVILCRIEGEKSVSL